MIGHILCDGRCKYYALADEGEDKDGNPYAPSPFCRALGGYTWLDDDPLEQECVAPEKKELEVYGE